MVRGISLAGWELAGKFDYFGAGMSAVEILFWILLALVFYTYIGYGMLLFVFLRLGWGRRARSMKQAFRDEWPSVAFLIPAYNESEVIGEKIRNTFSLDYPADRIRILVLADGSDDGTQRIARSFPGIRVTDHPIRKGKADAMNRGVLEAGDAEILVFSDANTLLDRSALKVLVRHYADPLVGAVSGEKKVMAGDSGMVQAEGESIYWRYESLLKGLDSRFYSVVGAAGELLSLRKKLFIPIPESTILDDFHVSLKVCAQGYIVKYEPAAVAMESASGSIRDEWKRKVRISAGAFQAIGRFPELLIPYPDPRLSFQYVSHRLMRWVVCPFVLPILLMLNILLIVVDRSGKDIYAFLLAGQCLFYFIAALGWMMPVRRKFRFRILYIPFYFLFMNYSVWAGLYKYLTHGQSSVWDKAKRIRVDN